MIQRVQTIYFLVALVTTLLLFIFPVWKPLPDMELFGRWIDGIGAFSQILLLAIAALLVLVELIVIFLFKKRPLQRFVSFVALLISLLYIGASFFVVYSERGGMDHFSFSELQFGGLLPLAGIVSLMMANRYIRKDEELLRSADRLR